MLASRGIISASADSAKQVEQLAHLLSIQGEILNEQYPSDAAPPEKEAASPFALLPDGNEPQERRSRAGWIAPAWFLFGILVGIAGFAAYSALIVKPAAPATQVDSTDPNSVRAAARQGVLEAIATLQAGGGQAGAQEPQGPQEVASNTFTVREANRQGSADAKVTVYEFSDFQ
jgi:hypothetical protein